MSNRVRRVEDDFSPGRRHFRFPALYFVSMSGVLVRRVPMFAFPAIAIPKRVGDLCSRIRKVIRRVVRRLSHVVGDRITGVRGGLIVHLALRVFFYLRRRVVPVSLLSDLFHFRRPVLPSVVLLGRFMRDAASMRRRGGSDSHPMRYQFRTGVQGRPIRLSWPKERRPTVCDRSRRACPS